MSPNLPMVEVAPATSFEATIVSWFTELNDGRGGPVEVRVNGEVVKEGQLSAQVLAELGIITRDLDDLWGDFVMANGWPIIQYSGLPGTPQMPDFFAVENQQGACWELHATVDPAQGVQTVRDLAYVDLAHVNRMVTFKLRQWNKLTIGDAAARDHDLSRNRWSSIVSKTQRLEPGSAVGSWYSGINQSEIDATYHTAHSLEAARRELDKALDEINIAIRVADAAWQGDRADAAKYKFCMESTIIESIRDVAHGWEDFIQDVVRLQRLAKDHDDKFRREVETEIGITILTTIITFGAAAILKGALFAAKLIKWGEEMNALRALMESKFGATIMRAAADAKVAWSARAIARGAGDMTSRAVIKGSTGQPIDGWDWFNAFFFAGAIGQGTSDLAKWGLKQVGEKFGVKFPGFAANGAAKGAIQGVPRGGAVALGDAVGIDASLGRVFVAYPVGIGGEAFKQTVKEDLRIQLRALMRADPDIRAAIERDVMEQVDRQMIYLPLTHRQEAIDKLIDAEIAKRVELLVDPLLDYWFTVGSRSVIDGTIRVAGVGDIQIKGSDLRTDRGGLVVQRVDSPPMPAASDLATSK